jgi:protease I
MSKKVAILVENFYEDMELQYPLYRLREEGWQVDLIGTEKGMTYKGKHGYPTVSDMASKDCRGQDYDLVLIPGGYSPDHMRRCQATIDFVKAADKAGKWLAAICHGGWMLASCCDLKGKKLTSFISIKDDMVNAGATWLDAELVVDANLISSRTPKDLIPFTKAMIQALKA